MEEALCNGRGLRGGDCGVGSLDAVHPADALVDAEGLGFRIGGLGFGVWGLGFSLPSGDKVEGSLGTNEGEGHLQSVTVLHCGKLQRVRLQGRCWAAS